MTDLRLPNITGTEKEQLIQIRSYLYQLVPQLQHALSTMGTMETKEVTPTPKSLYPTSAGSGTTPQTTFNSIKALIIKSAEIVNAYYEEINKRLEGIYVAQSDFGDYAEKTSQEIEANSTSTTQRFENIQVVITNQGGDIKSLEENLVSIEENLSFTQKDILTLGENVEGITDSVTTLENNVNDLDTSLQETSETINNTIISTEANLTTAISDAKTEIAENINAEIETAKGYTDETANELSGKIDTAKEELEGSIDITKSELTDKVEGVDADLQESKTATNDRISAIDLDLQASKEDFYNGIQGVQDSVGGVNALLEDAKSQLKGSIDDLEVYVKGIQDVIVGVTAYLKSGLLYYTEGGIPVYGLEVGQTVTDEVSGEEAFKKYARFTSEKLSFYDSNNIEVAYISDKKLYIRMAEIRVSFQIGGLIDLVMSNGDVVTKWIGG